MAGDGMTVEEIDAFSLLVSLVMWDPKGGDLINLHDASTSLQTSWQGLTHTHGISLKIVT